MDSTISETLYASDTFRLRQFKRRTTSVVVTFDHWEASKKGFTDFSGGSLREKRGWSQIHLNTSRNNGSWLPQYAVETGKLPFESRWKDDRAGIDHRFDGLDEYGAGLKKAIVAFDPHHAQDAAHVRLMQRTVGEPAAGAGYRSVRQAASLVGRQTGGHPAATLARHPGCRAAGRRLSAVAAT